jgi:hypothetical protein
VTAGGHFYGYRDDELAARWVQLGVFSPILRLHSSNNPWNSKEPWRFTQESRTAMNEALRLRHQLVPYLYSMNVLSARDGEALVKPIYWKYAERDEAYKVPNEFFFGSELLVVPMTSPRDKVTARARSRAWLPPGRHVDIFSGVVYDGDCEKLIYRGLDDYAVFSREGSIIPMDASKVPANCCGNPEELEVKIVVGADGGFGLVEDDGKGSGVDDAQLATTAITFEQKSGTATIGPVFFKGDSQPAARAWTVTFPALRAPESVNVTVGGSTHKAEATKTDVGTTVKIGVVPNDSKIIIELGKDPQLTPTDVVKHVYRVVDEAQMEFSAKKQIWAAVTSNAPLGVKLSKLAAMDLNPKLLEAIMEFMCADSRSG